MDKPRKKQGKPGGLPGGRDILPELKKEESVVPLDLLIKERSRLDSSLQFWGVDLWFPPRFNGAANSCPHSITGSRNFQLRY